MNDATNELTEELIETAEKLTGEPLKHTEHPRRDGDPPELVAIADRVREVLGWEPKYDDLDLIVKTSLDWERRIAAADPTAYWAA